MASKFGDFANDLFVAAGITSPTVALATTATGAGVDMATCANNNCFAMQNVGVANGTSVTFAGRIEEATTATGTYASIAGATFTALTSTTGTNIIQIINFQRSLRFVRYVGVIGGTTSTVALSVEIGGQKGQIGN